jgi:hypothetical protein
MLALSSREIYELLSVGPENEKFVRYNLSDSGGSITLILRVKK